MATKMYQMLLADNPATCMLATGYLDIYTSEAILKSAHRKY